MLVLACKCLNIRASFSGSTSSGREASVDSSVGPLKDFIGPFTNRERLLIETEHEELTSQIQQQQWAMTTCLVCNSIVYGQAAAPGSPDNPAVIFNGTLLTSGEAISALKLDESFSRLFKVVIRPSTFPDSSLDLLHSSDPDPKLKKLLSLFNERLHSMTEQVEERIRKFTEEQFLLLNEFRRAAETEFQGLARKIAPPQNKMPEEKKLISISVVGSNPLDTPPLTPDSGLTASPPTLRSASVRPVVSGLGEQKSAASMGRSHDDEEFTFTDLFGQDTAAELDPDDLSDENIDDDDDADVQEATETTASARYKSARQSTDALLLLGKSLPIPTPAIHTQGRNPMLEHPETQDVDIAASIQALAKSVHGSDGIFGDLPRPRLCVTDQNPASMARK